MSGWAKWAAITVAGVALLAVIGSSDDKAVSKPKSDWPPGAVAGSFDRTCGGLLKECSDKDAAKAVKVDDVWCRWERRDVIVHARVRNTFAANVTVGIVPRYRIENGGQHGTAFASDESIDVPHGATRVFQVNAGHPKGVADGTRISECSPKFQDVDLHG